MLIHKTLVVPLGDVAFQSGTPGLNGWAILELDGERQELHREPPPFWRELRLQHWHPTPSGRLVHPDLVRFL